MTNPHDYPLSADLLARMLSGQPAAWEEYYKSEAKLHARLVNMAKRFIPHLAKDLAEDVVSQMWTNLLWRKVRFDPQKERARAFLKACLRDSARDVSAQYAPPGQRTRPYKNSDGEVLYPVQSLSTEDEIELPSGKGRLGDFIPSREKDIALNAENYLWEIVHRASLYSS